MIGDIKCPDCGKVLTPETNDEECPATIHAHDKHPVFVMGNVDKYPWSKPPDKDKS